MYRANLFSFVYHGEFALLQKKFNTIFSVHNINYAKN